MITLVVPVYNMGKYLPRAMQSLLDQSFRDYEIILVDDGSTDGSAEVCDCQARGHDQVRVYHKENGGLSSARNYGVELARGQYITFPDPDDWVEPDYLERLMTGYSNPETDLSICGHYVTKGGEDRLWNPHAAAMTLDAPAAMEYLMQQNSYRGITWNKLYRMDLIREKDLRFEEAFGMNEDEVFTISYISHCRKIVYDPVPLYHYCRDTGGVTRLRKPLGTRELSIFDGYRKIADMTRETCPVVSRAADAWMAEIALRYIGVYYRTKMDDPKLLSMLRKIFRQYRRDFYDSKLFTRKRRCAAAVCMISPRFYCFLVSRFGHMKNV